MTDTGTAPAVTNGGIIYIALPREARNARLTVHLHMRSAERFDALVARHNAEPRVHRTEAGVDFRAASFEANGQAWKAFGPLSGAHEPGDDDAVTAELIEEPTS